jgi:hypothetical protein
VNPSRCDALFKIKHIPSKYGNSLVQSKSEINSKNEKSSKIKLPKIKTIYNLIEEKNKNLIDEPSVFYFQFQNGLIKANSSIIENLPETTLFTKHSHNDWSEFKNKFSEENLLHPQNVYPKNDKTITSGSHSIGEPWNSFVNKNVNYSNEGNKALKMGLVFKPKTNGHYRSQFKLEVFNGISIEFTLEGRGNSKSEHIQVNY